MDHHLLFVKFGHLEILQIGKEQINILYKDTKFAYHDHMVGFCSDILFELTGKL